VVSVFIECSKSEICILLKNEIYYSLCNSAIISSYEILGHCIVTSKKPEWSETKSVLAWSISPSKRSKLRKEGEEELAEDNVFCCQLAVDAQRGLFYEFHWELHRDAATSVTSEDKSKWVVAVEALGILNTPNSQTKIFSPQEKSEDADEDHDSAPSTPSRTRKRKRVNDATPISSSKLGRTWSANADQYEERTNEGLSPGEFDEPDTSGIDDQVFKTPSKKRGRSTKFTTTTPCHKRVQKLAAPTPHSKAALRSRKRRKALPMRPPPLELGQEYYRQLQNVPPDPWLRAMHVLHVAARPDALPCREEEYGRVLRSTEELIEEGSGGCVCKSDFVSTDIPDCCQRYFRCPWYREDGNSACCRARTQEDGPE
jgi:origin recognition complex subunit 1